MSYINNEIVTNALNGQPVHEILNAIHDEASEYYRKSVTRASFGNIQATGAGINANPALQNEFLSLLVTQVLPLAFSSPKLVNDYAWARGFRVPWGKTLQDTATDVIEPIEFDQYQSEFTEKQIFKPTVATRFYVKNREDQYPLTISKVLLMSAFDSDESFLRFVADQMNIIHSSDERSKAKYTIATLTEYYEHNKFKIVEAPNVLNGTAADAENFIEQINTHVLNMNLGEGTREYNNQGFVQRTDANRIHLFITTSMLSRLKLGVWAKVFNLSEAELRPQVHLVKQFGDHPEIQAIIVDEDWFHIHPNFESMTEATNNRGLYSTFYWTVMEIYAGSDFKNAMCIIDKPLDVPVYDVIIPLSSADVRRGDSITYDYLIRQTDEVDYVPVFTVEKPDGGVTLSTDTKFTGTTLTVGKDEKNKALQIKATVTVTTGSGESAQTHEIVGRAMVKPVK